MESEIFQRAVRVMKRWCATQIQFKLYRKLQILQDIRSSLLDKSMYNQLMMTMNSLNVFDLYRQLYLCVLQVSQIIHCLIKYAPTIISRNPFSDYSCFNQDF